MKVVGPLDMDSVLSFYACTDRGPDCYPRDLGSTWILDGKPYCDGHGRALMDADAKATRAAALADRDARLAASNGWYD